ncbi:2-dehydropantoate 2-reductase, partial [Mesorhizobium sp. M8A.F.Ca.ET.207.01.1.1]
HLAAMLQTGLSIQSDLGSFVLAPVSASKAAVDIGPVDLVIFAVKLYDSEEAAASIAPLVGANTRIVTLQNGIDSVEILCRHLPRDRVIGGATYLSGFISKPGE